MKKPPYIKLIFPERKGTFNTAAKRYLNSLDGKVLRLEFGEYRGRKQFEYKVAAVTFGSTWEFGRNKKTTQVRIVLKKIEKEIEA